MLSYARQKFNPSFFILLKTNFNLGPVFEFSGLETSDDHGLKYKRSQKSLLDPVYNTSHTQSALSISQLYD